MRATHLAITGQLFRRAPRPWCMGQDGITRRTSVPQCGMAGLTPTVWELDSPTRAIPDGASGSATDMPTIPGITRGGGQWGITDMAGTPITAGEHGEGLRSPTFTESGATRHTLELARLGQIPTPETMERRPAEPTTTPRPAGRRSLGAAPTPTSIRVIPPVIAAERSTTRTRGSLPAAAPDTSAISTVGKERRDAAGSPTTPIPEPVSRLVRTTFMPGKTAPCTATTGTAAVGQATAAAGGSPRPSRTPICNASSRCATRARNGRATLIPWAAQGWAVHAWVAEAAEEGSAGKPDDRFASEST